MKKRLNPKKIKSARRERHPITSTTLVSPKRVAVCKECMIRPREIGARCKQCIKEYHDSIKSSGDTTKS